MLALTNNLLMCTLCTEPDILMNLYFTHVRETSNRLRLADLARSYSGDLEHLERVQRKRTRAVRDVENVPYEQRLRQFDLLSFKGRLLRADLIYDWRIFNQQCAFNPNNIFQFPYANTTWGHP